jgi:hypothetical protein
MSFNRKEIICDVRGCNNTTGIIHVEDLGWRWVRGKKDVCPVCSKELFEKWNVDWMNYVEWKDGK